MIFEVLTLFVSGGWGAQIRVGMSVGHSPDQREVGHETISQNVTAADKAAAKRRVEGSLAPPAD